ncbi:hypothetical protein OEZ86_009502 [Tetradesmus obliquus]|uniref:Uncharacterized protein n=1 Tax=Tetradesmus obliquus TaxID=3088 RepID=A0ABY8UN11_TETOB|nr:hypothetical protein OEZ85_000949 [Tetradesmus obliquus]WIA42960.1 hypothetical protein OEZ86_009502 [Tetradesmus obliquus]
MLWLTTSKSCGAAPHGSKAIPWHSAAAVEVSTLQQRVVALQQSCEVQDKELAHLRAEDEVSRRQRAEADLAQFMAAMEEAG